MSPTFTVIMPTRNRATIMLDAVHCVIMQSNPVLEFVVGDPPTDDAQSRLPVIDDLGLRVVMNARTKGCRCAQRRNRSGPG